MNAKKQKGDEPEDADKIPETEPSVVEPVETEPSVVEPVESDPPVVEPVETDAETDADSAEAAEPLSEADEALLDAAATDLVADYREQAARAQAELVNFRTRVERDRAANRDAVIAEVIRSLLPALDDLSRAEKHGDLEGSPLEIVAVKLRGSLERFGLRSVGVAGEVFDPHLHEAVVQLPSADVKVQTVADVIDPGYVLGERLIRAAKVAVSVPAE